MQHRIAWLIMPVMLLLAGCGERYRYPCQDPTNWDKQECKKPFCSANGTCPEDLRHYEKDSTGPTPPTPGRTSSTIKGDNKC